MNKDILRRIKQSKRGYGKQAQKAALLSRKKAFLEERGKAVALIEKIYEGIGGSKQFFLDSSAPPEKRADRDVHCRISSHFWGLFCYRWSISSSWNGKISKLEDFVDSSVKISYAKASDSGDEKFSLKEFETDLTVDAWIMGLHGENDLDWLSASRNEISINILPETTIYDIRKKGPEIEKLQRSIFSYKSEAKSDFGRDLCWFDLREKFKLSVRRIAELWIEHRPDDAENMALRFYRKKFKDSILSDLNGAGNTLKNDEKLLHEIKQGNLQDNSWAIFKVFKKHYLEGKMTKGSVDIGFTPPVHAVIKASIKRIRNGIARL